MSQEAAHWREGWPEFVFAVERRLKAGAREYGDTSFSRPVAELVDEVAQEALDLAGWGFIVWKKARALAAICDTLDANGGIG